MPGHTRELRGDRKATLIRRRLADRRSCRRKLWGRFGLRNWQRLYWPDFVAASGSGRNAPTGSFAFRNLANVAMQVGFSRV
jgi:hypothetical protein